MNPQYKSVVRIFACFSMSVFLEIGAGAQLINPAKMPKPTAADFNPQSPVISENANAVVLVNVGSTDFEGNNNGDFSMVFTVCARILLRNRNGFDAATIGIVRYLGDNVSQEETLDKFEATTYNLEGDQIRETKSDKSALLHDKYNRRISIDKFTFPDIREGSIVEYRYTISSPHYSNFRTWAFQEKYPVLWSQYVVTIPGMFKYLVQMQGAPPFVVDSVSVERGKFYSVRMQNQYDYMRTNHYNITADAVHRAWAAKDIPAIARENYVSAQSNYVSRVKLTLQSIQFGQESHVMIKGWPETVEKLMENPVFGKPLTEQNGWLDDETKKVVSGAFGFEAAHRIYTYVRDHFSCTNRNSIYLDGTLKEIWQKHAGNDADINLLLTAMMHSAGFTAEPVLLSTREHGFASQNAAFLNDYNYVLCRAQVDTTWYLLDAAHPRLGFGRLERNAYNQYARVIDRVPLFLTLTTDTLHERKFTTLFMANEEDKNEDGAMVGTLRTDMGYIESTELRDRLAKQRQSDYHEELKGQYTTGIGSSNFVIDSLTNLDEPVSVSYTLKMHFNKDIVYFNPVLGPAAKKNPFTETERQAPVEMPFRMDENYVLDMEIPKGYTVDDMPRSARVKLNENEGMFEYLIAAQGGRLQLRCRTVLNKANFDASDYKTLRDFFGFIVKKEAEQVVFKKIKS